MASSATRTGLRLREQDLQDKVAIITGASRGIGRAIALNLASRGCSILGTCSSSNSVHLIDSLAHHVQELYQTSEQKSKPPKIVGLDANITDATTPKKIADAIERHFNGQLNIFINNACVASAAKIGELSDDHISDYLKGNIEIPVKLVEEFVKRKLFRPNSRIIHISSVRARKAWADQLMYMTTKAALEATVRAWSDAFGGKYAQYEFMKGTTANTVMPGITRTDALYNNNLPAELIQQFEGEFTTLQSIPGVARPEDVADVVGMLCREESRWVTGSVVSADAGGVSIL